MLPGNCALWRRMKRQKSAHFPHFGNPWGSGDVSLFFSFFFPPGLCFPLLSPLSMSCIITSRFKDRADEEQHRESEGQGWVKGGHMFVSITPSFQQGDRLEKYFLACQRKGPLTGGLRHHKSSVILSMPLSLAPSLTFCVSLSPYSSCRVENNPIHNFPRVALWISPSHRITGVTFTRSLFISVKHSKLALTSRPVQHPEQPHWTVSTDTSLSSNSATYLCDSVMYFYVKYYVQVLFYGAFIVKYHRHPYTHLGCFTRSH